MNSLINYYKYNYKNIVFFDCIHPCDIQIQSRQHSVWPKSRKRRKRRDENAPRMPLTGYIRFLNDRREILKHENPSLGFTEVTKQLGSEWSSLLPGVKQVPCHICYTYI